MYRAMYQPFDLNKIGKVVMLMDSGTDDNAVQRKKNWGNLMLVVVLPFSNARRKYFRLIAGA